MNDPVRIDERQETDEPARLRESGAPEDRICIAIERAAPDIAVLRITGDIDLLTASVLHDRIWPELNPSHTALVLDLTGVSFLGSAGLSELVAAHGTATERGVQLVLVASGRAVLRPLEIVGLRSLFRVTDSVEAAVREV